MMNKLLAVSAFLAVAGFGSQLSAQSHSYPGLMCRYYDPLGNDVYFDPGNLGANGLKNVSASNFYVSCPITKDLAKGVHFASIFLDDDVTDCRLYARTPLGVSTSAAPTLVRRHANQTTYEVIWQWGEDGSTDTWAPSRAATTAIYCRIDAGKQSIMYRSQAY